MLDNKNNKYYGVDSGCGSPQNWGNLQSAYSLRSHQSWWTSKGVKGAVLGLGLATLLPLTNAFGVTITTGNSTWDDSGLVKIVYGTSINEALSGAYAKDAAGNKIEGKVDINFKKFDGKDAEGNVWTSTTCYPARDEAYPDLITLTYLPTGETATFSLKVDKYTPQVDVWDVPTTANPVEYGYKIPTATFKPTKDVVYKDYTIKYDASYKVNGENWSDLNKALPVGDSVKLTVTWKPKKKDNYDYTRDYAEFTSEKTMKVVKKAVSNFWQDGTGDNKDEYTLPYGKEFKVTETTPKIATASGGADLTDTYFTSTVVGYAPNKPNAGTYKNVKVTYTNPNYTIAGGNEKTITLKVEKTAPEIKFVRSISGKVEAGTSLTDNKVKISVKDKKGETIPFESGKYTYRRSDEDGDWVWITPVDAATGEPTPVKYNDLAGLFSSDLLPYVTTADHVVNLEVNFYLESTSDAAKNCTTDMVTGTYSLTEKIQPTITWTPDAETWIPDPEDPQVQIPTITYGKALKVKPDDPVTGVLYQLNAQAFDDKGNALEYGRYVYIPQEGKVLPVAPGEDEGDLPYNREKKAYNLEVTYVPEGSSAASDYTQASGEAWLAVTPATAEITWTPHITYGTVISEKLLRDLEAEAIYWYYGEKYVEDTATGTGKIVVMDPAPTVDADPNKATVYDYKSLNGNVVSGDDDPLAIGKVPPQSDKYRVKVTFTPKDKVNFNFDDADNQTIEFIVPLVVGKYPVEIASTWNPTPTTITYGDKLVAGQLNAVYVDPRPNVKDLPDANGKYHLLDKDGKEIYRKGTDGKPNPNDPVCAGDSDAKDYVPAGTDTGILGEVKYSYYYTYKDGNEDKKSDPVSCKVGDYVPAEHSPYKLVATFYPAAAYADNYTGKPAEKDLKVNKATPTVSWPLKDATFTYGAGPMDWQKDVTMSGKEGAPIQPDAETVQPNGDPANWEFSLTPDVDVISAGVKPNAGVYTATLKKPETANYKAVNSTITFTVAPYPLVLAADNESIALNAEPPTAYGYTPKDDAVFAYGQEFVKDILGKEVPNPVCDYKQGDPADAYDIYFKNEAALKSKVSKNYALTIKNGKLYVGKNLNIVWNEPNPITDTTELTSGKVDEPEHQLNAQAYDANGTAIDGTYSYNYKVGDTLPAGNQKLTVTFTPDAKYNGKYNEATGKVMVWVKKDTTVVWADPEIMYKKDGAVLTWNDLLVATSTSDPKKGAKAVLTKEINKDGVAPDTADVSDKGKFKFTSSDENLFGKNVVYCMDGEKYYKDGSHEAFGTRKLNVKENGYPLHIEFIPNIDNTIEDAEKYAEYAGSETDATLTVKPCEANVNWTAWEPSAADPETGVPAGTGEDQSHPYQFVYGDQFTDGMLEVEVMGPPELIPVNPNTGLVELQGKFVIVLPVLDATPVDKDGKYIVKKEKDKDGNEYDVYVDAYLTTVTFIPNDKFAANYAEVTLTRYVVVKRATLSVAWPKTTTPSNPMIITYGTALSKSQFKDAIKVTSNNKHEEVAFTTDNSETVFKKGTDTVVGGIGSVLPVGTYDAYAKIIPTTSNYVPTSAKADLTVNAKKATVKSTAESYEIEYGDAFDSKAVHAVGLNDQDILKGTFGFTVAKYTEVTTTMVVKDGKVYNGADVATDYTVDGSVVYKKSVRWGITKVDGETTKVYQVTYPADSLPGIDPTKVIPVPYTDGTKDYPLHVIPTIGGWEQYQVTANFTPKSDDDNAKNFAPSSKTVALNVKATAKWHFNYPEQVAKVNWSDAAPNSNHYKVQFKAMVGLESEAIIVGKKEIYELDPYGDPVIVDGKPVVIDTIYTGEDIKPYASLSYKVDGVSLSDYATKVQPVLTLGEHTLVVTAKFNKDVDGVSRRDYTQKSTVSQDTETEKVITFIVVDPNEDPKDPSKNLIRIERDTEAAPQDARWVLNNTEKTPIVLNWGDAPLDMGTLHAIAKDAKWNVKVNGKFDYRLSGTDYDTVVTDKMLIVPQNLSEDLYRLTIHYTDPKGIYVNGVDTAVVFIQVYMTKSRTAWNAYWNLTGTNMTEAESKQTSAYYGSTLALDAGVEVYNAAEDTWETLENPVVKYFYSSDKGKTYKELTANTILHAGTYKVYAEYQGDEDKGYGKSATTPVDRTITAAPVKLSWKPEPQQYGHAPTEEQMNATATGFNDEDLIAAGKGTFKYPNYSEDPAVSDWPVAPVGTHHLVAEFVSSSKDYQSNPVDGYLVIEGAAEPVWSWGKDNQITVAYGYDPVEAQCIEIKDLVSGKVINNQFVIDYTELKVNGQKSDWPEAVGTYTLTLDITPIKGNMSYDPFTAETTLTVAPDSDLTLTFYRTPVLKDDDTDSDEDEAEVTAAAETEAGAEGDDEEGDDEEGDKEPESVVIEKIELEYGQVLKWMDDKTTLGIYQMRTIEPAEDDNKDAVVVAAADDEQDAEEQEGDELIATITIKATATVAGEEGDETIEVEAGSVDYSLWKDTFVLDEETQEPVPGDPEEIEIKNENEDSDVLDFGVYRLHAKFNPKDTSKFGPKEDDREVTVTLGASAVEVDWDIEDSYYAHDLNDVYYWYEIAEKDAIAFNKYLPADDANKLMAVDDPYTDPESEDNKGMPEKGCDNLTYRIAKLSDDPTLPKGVTVEDLDLDDLDLTREEVEALLEPYNPNAEVEVGIYYLVASYKDPSGYYGEDEGDDIVVITEPMVDWTWNPVSPIEYGTHLNYDDHLNASFSFAGIALDQVIASRIVPATDEDENIVYEVYDLNGDLIDPLLDDTVYVYYHDYDRILPVGMNIIRADYYVVNRMDAPVTISADLEVIPADPVILSNDGAVTEAEDGTYTLTVVGGTVFTGATAWAIDMKTLVDGIFTEGYINGVQVIKDDEILSDVVLEKDDVITLTFVPQNEAVPNYNPITVEWTVDTDIIPVKVTLDINGPIYYGDNVARFIGYTAVEDIQHKPQTVKGEEVYYIDGERIDNPFLNAGTYELTVEFTPTDTVRYGKGPYTDTAELVVNTTDQMIVDASIDQTEIPVREQVTATATAISVITQQPSGLEVTFTSEPEGILEYIGDGVFQGVAPGKAAIIAVQEGNNNYNEVVETIGIVEVTKRNEVTFFVEVAPVTFGDQKPAKSAYQVVGIEPEDIEVIGKPEFDTVYKAGDPVIVDGGYEIILTNASELEPKGYDFVVAEESVLVVNPAPVTVEAIVPEEALTYGVDLVELIRAEEPTISYTATATVDGEEVDLTDEGTVIYVVTSIDSEGEISVKEIDPLDPDQVPVVLNASEDAYGLTVEFTPSTTNFESAVSDIADLYVDKAVVIITPDTPLPIHYGDSRPDASKLTYTIDPKNAPVTGVELEIYDRDGNICPQKPNPDVYTIKVVSAQLEDEDNYVLAEEQGTAELIVIGDSANEVIFWTVPTPITYGTTIPLNAKVVDRQTGKVLAQNDELLYSYYDATSAVDQGIELTADTILDAGEYYLSAYWEADGVVYADTYIWLPVTVTKGTVAITADSKEITYGDPLPELTYTMIPDDAILVVPPTLDVLGYDGNVGTYTITVDAEDPNYEIILIDGTLTVEAAKVAITVDNKEINYGDKLPELTYSPADAPVVPTLEVVDYDGNAGTYTIKGTADDPNYEVAITDGTLTVKAIDVAITVDNKEINYGDKLPELTYSPADAPVVPTLEVVGYEGNAGTYTIKGTADDPNYNVAITDGTLTVKKADLTVQFIDAEDGSVIEDYTIFYGNELKLSGNTVYRVWNDPYMGGKMSLEAFYVEARNSEGELVDLEFCDVYVNGQSLYTDEPEQPLSAEGDYVLSAYVRAADPNYNWGFIYQENGKPLFVEKAYQEIVDPEVWPWSLTVGDNISDLECYASATSGLPVDHAIATEPEGIVDENGTLIATGKVIVTFTQDGDENYKAAQPETRIVPVEEQPVLTVVPVSETVVFDNEPSWAYTVIPSDYQDVVKAEVVPDDNYDGSVGTYDLAVVVDETTVPAGYKLNTEFGKLDVIPATVAVIAKDQTIKANQEPDPKAYMVNPDAATEFVSVSLDFGGYAGVAGEYDITVTAKSTSKNYELVETVGAKLTVTELEAVYIIPVVGPITYGDPKPAQADYSYVTEPAGVTIIGTPEYDTIYNAGDDATTYGYLVRVLNADKLKADGYDVVYAKHSNLVVNKASLTVTADNKSVTCGDPAPEYTVSYKGFVNGDTESDLGGKLAIACDYTTTSEAGTYDIIPSGLTSGNYDIAFINGVLTATKKDPIQVTVTAEAEDFTYGEDLLDNVFVTIDPTEATGTLTYILVNEEGEEIEIAVPTAAPEAILLDAGTYELTVKFTSLDPEEYTDAVSDPVEFTVDAIEVTVTAYAAEGMIAGDNVVNFLDYTAVDADGEAVDGSIYYLVFTEDDPLPVITVDPTSDEYQTLPAGVYEVVPSFIADDFINYQVDPDAIGTATLIVEEIPVTVSIEWTVPEEIVYGTAIALNAKVYVDGEEVENPVVEYYLDNEDTPLGEGWILPVDTYQVKAVFIAPLGADYSGAETAWMPVAVTPKALTVTLDDAEVVYGEDLVLPEVEIEGLLEGDSVTYDVTSIYHAGTTSAGTYKDGIIATLSEDSDNYEAPAQVTSTLTVKKATQEVILVVNPTVLNVGDSATATVVTTSGLTDFTLVISDPSILSPNLVALKVGTVTVTAKQAGDKNYEPAESNTVEVTVAPKAEVQITWEPKSPITYGTILSAEHLNATAELDGKKVEGHFYYNPTFGYVVTPESPFVVNGKLRLSATFIPTDRKRYKNAYVEVLVDIVVEEDDTTDDGEDAPTLTISKAGSVKGMVNAAADALVITFTGTLEESTDGVTWTPVADAKDGTYVVDVKVASKKFYRSVK